MINSAFYNYLPRIIDFYHTVKTLNVFNKIQTFVQVGAHDGVMHDPLREFILKNKWNGLLIEPQLEMYEKCRHNYAKIDSICILNAAVHPIKKKIRLYKPKNPKDYSHTGWASINSLRFNDTIYKDNLLEETVQAIHLMDAIRNHQIKKVDVLQIDTEGFDFEILKMFDFKKYSPLIIQYENRHLLEKSKLSADLVLRKHKYVCFHYKNDTFAIRKDLIRLSMIGAYVLIRIFSSINSRFIQK